MAARSAACTARKLSLAGQSLGASCRRPHQLLVAMAARMQRYSSLPARQGVPSNAWDSHMHIVGSAEKYPLSANAAYQPEEVHGVEEACAFECQHGTPRMVLVQPSIYGSDNSCLLDGLKVLTPKFGRGVVEFDPQTISQSTLQEWHKLGVRGVRVNVKSVTERLLGRDEFEQLLRPYADAIKPLDWVLDLHVALPMVETLETFASTLGVRVCIDHFGGPTLGSWQSAQQPYQLAGFSSLVSLLRAGSTWVKLSAVYRLSKAATLEEQVRQTAPLAHELLSAAPDRVVYASDWPHTRFGSKVDAEGYRNAVVKWCKEIDYSEELARKVFLDNPETLWK